MSNAEASPRPPYRLPRVKREHQAVHRDDGTIQVGGDILGIASVFDDPDGSLWQIIRLLDGTRSIEQLHTDSGQPRDTVAALVEALYEGGFLEDAATQDSTTLSAREQERYSRNQAFYRWIDLTPRPSPWTVQERIKAARVVVLGLGGGGSSVALALAASGVGNLHLVDHDRVELSNLTRQFLYCEADIGRTKVDAAVARLRSVNSTITITGEEAKVESIADLSRLIENCDVLAMCADRPLKIRHWADTACHQAGIPWVTGGYVGPVSTVQILARDGGACVECMHLRSGELSSDAPAVISEQDDPELLDNDQVAASTAISAGMSGLMIAHGVLAHITGAPDFGGSFQFGMNLAAPEQQLYMTGDRHPQCPVCADRT